MGLFALNEIQQLFPGATTRTYTRGQVIMYGGDQPNHVMYVKSGAYKFYDIDRQGNEKILFIDGSGSIFPLFYTFEDKSYVSEFYASLSRLVLVMIPLDEFRQEITKNSVLSARILKWHVGQMDQVVNRLKSLEKSTARHKVLEALLYLSNQRSVVHSLPNDWYRVTFPLSQQTLADFTGLTRETVNASMKAIERLGVVRVPQKLVLEINRTNLKKALD
mgnify:CR=1 FL=1